MTLEGCLSLLERCVRLLEVDEPIRQQAQNMIRSAREASGKKKKEKLQLVNYFQPLKIF